MFMVYRGLGLALQAIMLRNQLLSPTRGNRTPHPWIEHGAMLQTLNGSILLQKDTKEGSKPLGTHPCAGSYQQ